MMAGIYKENYVPNDPPLDGRYVVWTKSQPDSWQEAWMLNGEWRLPRGEGELTDVLTYMDLDR